MRDANGVLLVAAGLTYAVQTLDKLGLVISFAGVTLLAYGVLKPHVSAPTDGMSRRSSERGGGAAPLRSQLPAFRPQPRGSSASSRAAPTRSRLRRSWPSSLPRSPLQALRSLLGQQAGDPRPYWDSKDLPGVGLPADRKAIPVSLGFWCPTLSDAGLPAELSDPGAVAIGSQAKG